MGIFHSAMACYLPKGRICSPAALGMLPRSAPASAQPCVSAAGPGHGWHSSSSTVPVTHLLAGAVPPCPVAHPSALAGTGKLWPWDFGQGFVLSLVILPPARERLCQGGGCDGLME